MKLNRQSVLSACFAISWAIVAGGLKLAFSDMIIPFEWAMTFAALGLVGIIATAFFSYREYFPKITDIKLKNLPLSVYIGEHISTIATPMDFKDADDLIQQFRYICSQEKDKIPTIYNGSNPPFLSIAIVNNSMEEIKNAHVRILSDTPCNPHTNQLNKFSIYESYSDLNLPPYGKLYRASFFSLTFDTDREDSLVHFLITVEAEGFDEYAAIGYIGMRFK